MYDLQLKQSLGQNFLRDKNVARKIVSHVEVSGDDTVVEIGPGGGAITGLLAEKCGRVEAVEIDKRFAEPLREKYASFSNLVVRCEDFLKTDIRELYDKYGILTIVGNLPYHITSSILFKLFDNRECVKSAYIMVQREVGDRILSGVNSKNRGILSVLSQYYCKVNSLFPVSKNVFIPKPKVDSLFVSLRFFEKPEPAALDEKLFRDTVKQAFGKRRKYLRNSLKEIEGVDLDYIEAEHDLKRRPEELTVEEFVGLANTVYKTIS